MSNIYLQHWIACLLINVKYILIRIKFTRGYHDLLNVHDQRNKIDISWITGKHFFYLRSGSFVQAGIQCGWVRGPGGGDFLSSSLPSTYAITNTRGPFQTHPSPHNTSTRTWYKYSKEVSTEVPSQENNFLIISQLRVQSEWYCNNIRTTRCWVSNR